MKKYTKRQLAQMRIEIPKPILELQAKLMLDNIKKGCLYGQCLTCPK